MKKNAKVVCCFLIALSILFFASCDSAPDAETSTQAVDTAEVTADTAASETSAKTNEIEAPIRDGSFSTELYSVTNVDGVCYLNFVGGNDATGETVDGASTVGGPLFFADMDEMYRVFSEGTLTDDMAEQMKWCFRKTEQGILFPNLDRLHVPVLPEGLQFDGASVEGAAYNVEFASEGRTISGQAKFVSKALFDAYYAKEYTGFTDNEKLKNVTAREDVFCGSPCTVIEYCTSVAEARALQLTIEQEEGRLSVLVQYCLSSTSSLIQPSDTIPYSIRMYYEGADGVYARIVVPIMDQELTLEWLQAFGATDFIPETAE